MITFLNKFGRGLKTKSWPFLFSSLACNIVYGLICLMLFAGSGELRPPNLLNIIAILSSGIGVLVFSWVTLLVLREMAKRIMVSLFSSRKEIKKRGLRVI